MNSSRRGLYPILDLDRLSARGASPLAFAERLLAARPRWLQLRAKQASPRDALAVLRALAPACRASGTLLFANDRPDLAVLAGADGVHLGQDDLTVEEARSLHSRRPPSADRSTAPALALGISTHDLDQLETALAARPEYVALGPIFETRSKRNPDPVVGLDTLAHAARRAAQAGIPLVAIGGIDQDRAHDIGRLGVAAAVIGALDLPDLDAVESTARALQAALGS